MPKNITLQVFNLTEVSSFQVVASVQNNTEPIQTSEVFTLSPLTKALDQFSLWKKSLRQYIPIRREQLRGGPKTSRRALNSFHLSEAQAYQECDRAKREFVNSFNVCLNNSNFQNWLQAVLESTTESVRIIIQTDSLEIASLPWEQWSFWDRYYDANNLVIALSFANQENIILPATQQTTGNPTKILVLLGDEASDENQIDLEHDRKAFEKFEHELKKLGDRANVTVCIKQPNRAELETCLRQDWHIIYYGGHSKTLEAEKDGILYLRDRTQVKISELETSLQQNLEQGTLRLVIANACQGLGAALRLISLGLPHAIVMRESIPDDLAHDFLRYLLESFVIGLPVTSAIQHCKPHLRQAYDLRHQLPGASLLPALCLTLDALNGIDTPMIPLTEIHPICQEMRALANLAKARLTLENTQDLEALQVQEYYANLLKLKDKVTYEGVTTEIGIEQIFCSEPRFSGKRIWEVDFLASIQGQTLVWGQGFVNLESGYSELLLDVRPWSWIGAPIIVEGQELKRLSLDPNATIYLNDQEQKASFTKLALFNLEQKYSQFIEKCTHSQYAKEVKNFGGWLKDINKKKFLKQLVILQHQGMTEIEAQQESYRKTPFGRARHELGITEVTVAPPKDTFTSLANIIWQDEWTERDKEELRQEGVTEDYWPIYKVPQYVVISTARRPAANQ